MEFLATDSTVYYITIAMTVSYGLLFLYHCIKKDTNSSLTIIAGCLCVGMVFIHLFSSFKNAMDSDSWLASQMVLNQFLIWVVLNCSMLLAIFTIHKISKTQFHFVTRYVFRCLCISIALNLAIHIDIIIFGNRDPNWLWTAYSYGENLMSVFMFCSVLIARKWSEVFRWLQLAHAQ